MHMKGKPTAAMQNTAIASLWIIIGMPILLDDTDNRKFASHPTFYNYDLYWLQNYKFSYTHVLVHI